VNRHLIVLAVAGATALGAPATAAAEVSLSVQGDRIVFQGDEASTQMSVVGVQDGEQRFSVQGGARIGPGCRDAGPPPPFGPPPDFGGDIACSLAGVTAFAADAGPGDDLILFMSTQAMHVPTFVDMGPGNDWWDLGSTATDTATGGDGNDRVLNGVGDDVLRGGPGDDVVYGGDFDQGNDQIFGEDGNDTLDGLGGDDLIDGGAGDDDLQPGAGNDRQDGGQGNDRLDGRDGNDRQDGGPGNDRLDGGAGDDSQDGGDGDDTVFGSEGDDTQIGGPGNDQVGFFTTRDFPTPACAAPGNDTADGGPGDDYVCGGPGVDTISAGDGADRVTALDDARDAAVSCGAGADLLNADPVDPVDVDCERQAQDDPLVLPKSGLLRVPVPCAAGCTGSLTLAESPKATAPTPFDFPQTPPAASRKVLARSKFKLKRGTSKLRLKLPVKTVKQLRKRRKTSVEVRLQVTTGGRKVTIKRTFPIAKK
jgi:Ca2+-binding RTX toxin-like protein